MAYNTTVYNQLTRNSRQISGEVEVAYIQTESTPAQDFYIKLQVAAVNKAGQQIGPFFLTALTDLPDNGGTKQHPNGSSSPFASLTAQVENYMRHAMEGDGGNTGMDF